MYPVIFEIVELAGFTEDVTDLVDDETLREFQNELIANPEAGDLIPGSGGLRKARMKLPARGKSGSARVIYLWLPKTKRMICFMFYTKGKTATIPPSILKLLKLQVEKIKTAYS